MGNAELRFKLTEIMRERKKHRDALAGMERKGVSIPWADGKTTLQRVEEEDEAIRILQNTIKEIQIKA